MNSGQALPIQRLTLYKHGVAFVERRGSIDGAELQLVFRADEVNDALKSLLAIDRHGGHVLSIGYDTPADVDARLAENPIKLAPTQSVMDLVSSLRGVAVRLVAGDGAQREELIGRLIGVDIDVSGRPPRPAVVALLDDATGGVRLLLLDELRAL